MTRIEQIIRDQGRTVLIVSHIIRQIERLCSRVLMLDHGRLVGSGVPKEICDQFVDMSNAKIANDRANNSTRFSSTPDFVLTSLSLCDIDGTNIDAVSAGDDLIVRVRFELKESISDALFSVGIHTTDLFFISISASETDFKADRLAPGNYLLNVALRNVSLSPGTYGIHFGVEAGISSARVFLGDNLATFHVTTPKGAKGSATERLGVVSFDFDWSYPVAEHLEHAELSESGG